MSDADADDDLEGNYLINRFINLLRGIGEA